MKDRNLSEPNIWTETETLNPDQSRGLDTGSAMKTCSTGLKSPSSVLSSTTVSDLPESKMSKSDRLVALSLQ